MTLDNSKQIEYNFYNIRNNFKQIYKEYNNKQFPETFEDYVDCPSSYNSNIKFSSLSSLLSLTCLSSTSTSLDTL